MLWIEKFLVSPFGMISLLCCLTLIGWLFLVKLFPKSDDFWHNTDFWWLVLSAIGIFGLFGENRKFFAERELNKINYFKFHHFEWRFEFELNPQQFKRYFIESTFSPDYLPYLQEDYDNMYLWVTGNREEILTNLINRESIKIDSLNFPAIISPDKILSDYITTFEKLANEYNDLLNESKVLKSEMELGEFELIYILFSPLFIVIGLAFRFTRYFGEKQNKILNKKADVS